MAMSHLFSSKEKRKNHQHPNFAVWAGSGAAGRPGGQAGGRAQGSQTKVRVLVDWQQSKKRDTAI